MSKDFLDLDKLFSNPHRIVEPYSWVEHIPFAFFIVDLLRPDLFVELGVHTGNSYNCFCQAVSTLQVNTKCYGVDTWKGDEQAGFYDETVFDELQRYNREKYGDFSYLLKMTFDEALDYFSDGTVDLLHIDGYHTYEVVRHDFESWLAKLSERGVVLLHDTQVRDRNFGVWRLWEEISNEYPSFEFTHGYGLGVSAVGRKAGKELLEFIKEFNDRPFYQNVFSRLGRGLLDRTVLDKTISESDRLQGIVGERERELERLKDQAASGSEELGQLRSSLGERDEELERLRSHIAEKDGELERLRSDIGKRDEELGHLGSQLARRDEEIGRLSEVVSAGENELASLRDQVIERGGEVERLQALLTEKHGMEGDLQAQISRANDEMGRLRAKLEEEREKNDRLIEKAGEGDRKLGRLEVLLGEREGRLEDLQARVVERSEEVGRLRIMVETRDGQLEDLRDRLKRRDEEAGLLQGLAAEKDNELADLKTQIIQTNEDITHYRDQLTQRDQELGNAKGAIETCNGRIQELTGSIAQRDTDIHRLLVERATFGAQFGRLLTKIRERLAPRETLRNRMIARLIRYVRTLYYGRKKGERGRQEKALKIDRPGPLKRTYTVAKNAVAILMSYRKAYGILKLLKTSLLVLRKHNRIIPGIFRVLGTSRHSRAELEAAVKRLVVPDYSHTTGRGGTGLVSIVILTKNRLDLIKPCVESIEENLSERYKVEILIGDTGSDEKKVKEFYNDIEDTYDNIRVVYLDKYNFSRNHNYLIEKYAKGQYVILLNNDTVVRGDWIDGIVDCLDDGRIGVVGAKLLFEDNTIQHAGMKFVPHKDCVAEFLRKSRNYREGNYKALVTAVSFACVGVRQDVYNRFKLSEDFKEECQDTDFCLRLREAGYKVLYNPEVEIYHFQCSSRDPDKGYPDRELLKARWDKAIDELLAQDTQRVAYDEDEYRDSITVIRDDGIGDLLMGVSAFKKLREKFPEKKLIMATYRRNIEMMAGFDIFDEFIPIPNGRKYSPLPIPKHSTVYDFIDLEMDFGPIWGRTKEENKQHRNFVYCREMGLDDDFNLVAMPDYLSARENVARMSREMGIEGDPGVVVLSLMASNPARSWWEPYYPELITSIEGLGFTPVVVGLKDSPYFTGSELVNLVGRTATIPELIETIKLARFVVSTDTSAYHIAAMCGIPFLAIFSGGVNPQARLCFYDKCEAIHPPSSLKCYPCWDEGCKDMSIRWKEDPCRLAITPEEVMSKFRKLVYEHHAPDTAFPRVFEDINTRTVVRYNRLCNIYRHANQLRESDGSFAEVGVYKGGVSKMLAESSPEKRLHLFDTFEGLPKTDPRHDLHTEGDFNDAMFEEVKSYLSNYKNVTIYPGFFPDTAQPLKDETFSLVHLDGDLYKTTLDGLDFFFPRLVPNGVIIVDDYEWHATPGVKQAIDDYFRDKKANLKREAKYQLTVYKE